MLHSWRHNGRKRQKEKKRGGGVCVCLCGRGVVVLTLQTLPDGWTMGKEMGEKNKIKETRKCKAFPQISCQKHTLHLWASNFLQKAHETPGKPTLTPTASEHQSVSTHLLFHLLLFPPLCPFSNIIHSPPSKTEKHTAKIKINNSPNPFLSFSLPLSITAPAGEAGLLLLLLPWPRPQLSHVTAIPSD